VSDFENTLIRKITPAGIVSTFAGLNEVYTGGPLYPNGPISVAKFGLPNGVAVDASGNVYVADGIGEIRKISN
jgi:hypothetical protein